MPRRLTPTPDRVKGRKANDERTTRSRRDLQLWLAFYGEALGVGASAGAGPLRLMPGWSYEDIQTFST